MNEVWVRTNPRLYLMPAAGLAVIAALPALVIVAGGFQQNVRLAPWLVVAAVGLAFAALLALFSRRPRLAFDGTNVRFYVRAGSRVDVPVELVEAFLIGRGPTYLPGHTNDTTETTTLVVRISERAEEFNHVETTPTLAAWCGHYCTLRGTWTEPLSIDLVNRLNQRLYDAQQARKKQVGAAGAGMKIAADRSVAGRSAPGEQAAGRRVGS